MARGQEVVLVARRKDRLNQLAAEVGNAHVIAADLSEPDAPAKLLADVASRGLWVRTLINNAGFGLRGRFDALPLDRQLEMIDLNIRALTNLSFVVINDMVLKGGGSILNVASTAAFQPGPNMAVYFATKAFVLSFTEALHEEWKDRGIKVSALCPGPTRTEFGQVAGIKALGQFDRVAMEAEPVVRAGLEGLEANRRRGHPRRGQQGRRLVHTLRSSVRRQKDRRLAEVLGKQPNLFLALGFTTLND